MEVDHYLAKIERNTEVLDKAPVALQDECRQHIIWARQVASRLEELDYDVRQNSIANIIAILDADYIKMGFQVENSETNSMMK